MARITVDPITRIEGHLRIDVEVDGGAVRNSWSSGQMWRGIEVILKGRIASRLYDRKTWYPIYNQYDRVMDEAMTLWGQAEAMAAKH